MAEKMSNRLMLRVKRRRSNSPAEALIITDGVSQVKRAKKGKYIEVIFKSFCQSYKYRERTVLLRFISTRIFLQKSWMIKKLMSIM